MTLAKGGTVLHLGGWGGCECLSTRSLANNECSEGVSVGNPVFTRHATFLMFVPVVIKENGAP